MTVKRLELPLPNIELGHVNIYVVECEDGVALIDVGMATYECAVSLVRGLKKLGVKVGDVARVYVTHFHADHITLSPLLYEVASPDFYIGRGELLHVASSFDELYGLYVEEYKRHGVPPEVVEGLQRVHPMWRFRKVFEEVWNLPWRGVDDGDDLGCGLKAISTPGHTPGHVVYYSEVGLYTGDHVLPKITPNISWYPVKGFNPLREYFKSLEKLNVERPAYPAHGGVISNLSVRVEELKRHHVERLREILDVLEAPMSTFEVARRVKWSVGAFDRLDVFNKIFAVGEAYSHLLYLEEMGAVERVEKDVVYWRRVY